MEAHKLLAPLLGATLASTLFAVALLASGQNSTLTGTLAGQIVMEGFLHIRLKPWLRRLITRGIAIIPAFIVTVMYGERGLRIFAVKPGDSFHATKFAVIPLILFTNDRHKMGRFANSMGTKIIAWVVAAIILVLNLYLLYDTLK